MSLIKRGRDAFSNFPTLFNDYTSNNFWKRSLNGSNAGTTVPAVNVKETSDSFEVEMAARRMKKNERYGTGWFNVA